MLESKNNFFPFLPVKSNALVIVKQTSIVKQKKKRWFIIKCLKKVCAKFEVNWSSSFRVTVSTDFENTGFEKNARTSEKLVRRWGDSKSYIFGSSDPIKLKLLQTVFDVIYVH